MILMPGLPISIVPESMLQLKMVFAKRVNYTPSLKQSLVHKSNARYRVISAGARFGKSMLAGFEAAFHSLFYDFHTWLVGPSYILAEKELAWTMEFLSRFKLSNRRKLIDLATISNPLRGPKEIKFPWGAYIQTKSTLKQDNLLGEPVDFMILCEASKIPRQVYDYQLRPRLGDRLGSLLATSTGDGDSNLFASMVARGQDEEQEDWQSWAKVSTKENPTFSLGEWQHALETMDEDVVREQYMGDLVSKRGKVFKFTDFHIFVESKENPFDPNKYTIFRGIQPGYKNYFVCLWVAFDIKTKTYYVFDEYYEKEVLLEKAVEEIYNRDVGRRVIGTFTDYWHRGGVEDFAKAGLAVRANEEERTWGKLKSLEARIRCINNLFSINKAGETRLLIKSTCENLINELTKSEWPDRKPEESGKLEEEIPLPKHLSGPLALSYVTSFIETSAGIDIYTPQVTRKDNKEKF